MNSYPSPQYAPKIDGMFLAAILFMALVGLALINDLLGSQPDLPWRLKTHLYRQWRSRRRWSRQLPTQKIQKSLRERGPAQVSQCACFYCAL